MVDANALLADLSRHVQNNDIESGKIALTKIKVSMADPILLARVRVLFSPMN